MGPQFYGQQNRTLELLVLAIRMPFRRDPGLEVSGREQRSRHDNQCNVRRFHEVEHEGRMWALHTRACAPTNHGRGSLAGELKRGVREAGGSRKRR